MLCLGEAGTLSGRGQKPAEGSWVACVWVGLYSEGNMGALKELKQEGMLCLDLRLRKITLVTVEDGLKKGRLW